MQLSRYLATIGLASTVLAVPVIESTSLITRNDPSQSIIDVTAIITKCNTDIEVVIGDITDKCNQAPTEQAQDLIKIDINVDLGKIVTDLTVAVGAIINVVLPTVIAVVEDVVEVVVKLLEAVLELVTCVVGDLLKIVEGLLGPIVIFLEAEVKAILLLVSPLLLPILHFVETTLGGETDLMDKCTQIIILVNGALPAHGIPSIPSA